MKFFIYSVYDPEVESFDSRLNLGPLPPDEMAEQYRRAHIKMKDEDRAFMEGKKAVVLGVFDDVTGKIEQDKALSIYEFKTIHKEEAKDASSQVEEEKSANA